MLYNKWKIKLAQVKWYMNLKMFQVHIDKNSAIRAKYLGTNVTVFVDTNSEHFQVHVSLDGQVLKCYL